MISLYTSNDLKRLLKEIVDISPREYCILGFSGSIEKLMGQEYIEFQKERVSKGIHRRILAQQDVSELLSQSELTEVRFLPTRDNVDAGLWVYGDRSVLILPAPNPLFLKIRNAGISREFQNYFDIMWDIYK